MIHKVITSAGTLIFCISGAALDGPDWILGLIGVFAGLGIGCIGYMLPEKEKDPYGWQSAESRNLKNNQL